MGELNPIQNGDGPCDYNNLSAAAVREQVNRILDSAAFRKAKRLARFLRYAVDHALAGREEHLKETVLGIEVFDRGPDFDPRSDPIVRIDARRLRSRLADYYSSEGIGDPVNIEFHPGSYVPVFRRADDEQQAMPKRGPSAAPKGVKALLVLTRLAQARQQLHSLSPSGIVRSMALFEKVIAGNPDYALAWVGHGMSSMTMALFFYEPSQSAMPRAQASLERALEIDPACAEAHATLGALRALHQFDFAGANAAFLMALRLKPDSIPIRQAYATFYLAPRGFLQEAIDEVREAVDRERGSLIYLHSLAWLQYLDRSYEESLRTIDRVLKKNRTLAPAIFMRGLALERLGRHSLAAEAFANDILAAAHPLVPLRTEALRLIREGDRTQAAHVASKMEAMYLPGFLNALAIAEVFAALPDLERAFEWLDKAWADRRHRIIYLKSDPAWDPIRSDARFHELLASLRLADSAARASRSQG